MESQVMFRDEDQADALNTNSVYPSLVYRIDPNENSVGYVEILGTFFSVIGESLFSLVYRSINKSRTLE